MELNEKYLIEVYFDRENNEDNFVQHYTKHVLGYGKYGDRPSRRIDVNTMNEYDELANVLSEMPCGDIDSDERVIGYIARNGLHVKYDTIEEILVAYKPEEVISLYKIPLRRFEGYLLHNPKFSYREDLPISEKDYS